MAADGQQFENVSQAVEHERSLFEAWLETKPSVPVDVIMVDLDGTQREEFRGTSREVFSDCMFIYWERHVARFPGAQGFFNSED
jgi:hypothetical protein